MSSEVLARARAGDSRAFSELIAPYRRELRRHCYRMLGSLFDADDVLQETLTAAWAGLGGFEERASMRTWLYRIATNRCLNAVRDQRRRVRTEPVPPFAVPEPSRRSELTWLQPWPDEPAAASNERPDARYDSQETIELAFVVALQRLPPRQAAALILVDVLGFDPPEAADLLDATPMALKGLLQRARKAHVPAADRHRPNGGRGSESELGVARRFATAFTAGDVGTIVAMLTDDAWLAMPPAPHEYLGPGAIGTFLRISNDWRGSRPLTLAPTRANGQPAWSCVLTAPDIESAPGSIIVLTLRGDRISRITRFLDDALLPRFAESPGDVSPA